MTSDEMPACVSCGSHWTSPYAASTCCDPEYDKPAFERAYD